MSHNTDRQSRSCQDTSAVDALAYSPSILEKGTIASDVPLQCKDMDLEDLKSPLDPKSATEFGSSNSKKFFSPESYVSPPRSGYPSSRRSKLSESSGNVLLMTPSTDFTPNRSTAKTPGQGFPTPIIPDSVAQTTTPTQVSRAHLRSSLVQRLELRYLEEPANALATGATNAISTRSAGSSLQINTQARGASPRGIAGAATDPSASLQPGYITPVRIVTETAEVPALPKRDWVSLSVGLNHKDPLSAEDVGKFPFPINSSASAAVEAATMGTSVFIGNTHHAGRYARTLMPPAPPSPTAMQAEIQQQQRLAAATSAGSPPIQSASSVPRSPLIHANNRGVAGAYAGVLTGGVQEGEDITPPISVYRVSGESATLQKDTPLYVLNNSTLMRMHEDARGLLDAFEDDAVGSPSRTAGAGTALGGDVPERNIHTVSSSLSFDSDVQMAAEDVEPALTTRRNTTSISNRNAVTPVRLTHHAPPPASGSLKRTFNDMSPSTPPASGPSATFGSPSRYQGSDANHSGSNSTSNSTASGAAASLAPFMAPPKIRRLLRPPTQGTNGSRFPLSPPRTASNNGPSSSTISTTSTATLGNNASNNASTGAPSTPSRRPTTTTTTTTTAGALSPSAAGAATPGMRYVLPKSHTATLGIPHHTLSPQVLKEQEQMQVERIKRAFEDVSPRDDASSASEASSDGTKDPDHLSDSNSQSEIDAVLEQEGTHVLLADSSESPLPVSAMHECDAVDWSKILDPFAFATLPPALEAIASTETNNPSSKLQPLADIPVHELLKMPLAPSYVRALYIFHTFSSVLSLLQQRKLTVPLAEKLHTYIEATAPGSCTPFYPPPAALAEMVDAPGFSRTAASVNGVPGLVTPSNTSMPILGSRGKVLTLDTILEGIEEATLVGMHYSWIAKLLVIAGNPVYLVPLSVVETGRKPKYNAFHLSQWQSDIPSRVQQDTSDSSDSKLRARVRDIAGTPNDTHALWKWGVIENTKWPSQAMVDFVVNCLGGQNRYIEFWRTQQQGTVPFLSTTQPTPILPSRAMNHTRDVTPSMLLGSSSSFATNAKTSPPLFSATTAGSSGSRSSSASSTPTNSPPATPPRPLYSARTKKLISLMQSTSLHPEAPNAPMQRPPSATVLSYDIQSLSPPSVVRNPRLPVPSVEKDSSANASVTPVQQETDAMDLAESDADTVECITNTSEYPPFVPLAGRFSTRQKNLFFSLLLLIHHTFHAANEGTNDVTATNATVTPAECKALDTALLTLPQVSLPLLPQALRIHTFTAASPLTTSPPRANRTPGTQYRTPQSTPFRTPFSTPSSTTTATAASAESEEEVYNRMRAEVEAEISRDSRLKGLSQMLKENIVKKKVEAHMQKQRQARLQALLPASMATPSLKSRSLSVPNTPASLASTVTATTPISIQLSASMAKEFPGLHRLSDSSLPRLVKVFPVIATAVFAQFSGATNRISLPDLLHRIETSLKRSHTLISMSEIYAAVMTLFENLASDVFELRKASTGVFTPKRPTPTPATPNSRPSEEEKSMWVVHMKFNFRANGNGEREVLKRVRDLCKRIEEQLP